MKENSVSIKGLSKSYRVYPSSKARLAEMLLLGKKKFHRDFWALKDISFDIEGGEIFGIIGANGAGKSTLLKILAGISSQSSGTMDIKGKVSALLELGAGFHPEFTGRDNLYMNGALLGFSKKELDGMYDEIVDFAELWDFMDMPVKTYSSGMYVRLGFSIATSVNPDILIIDEALSVGDEYFQKKCVDRMKSFMDRGKTLVFVSHNLGLISRICGRSLWLDEGTVKAYGETKEVLEKYDDFMRGKSARDDNAEQEKAQLPAKDVVIDKVSLLGPDGAERKVFSTGEDLTVKIDFTALKPVRDLTFGVAIKRNDYLYVTGPNTYTDDVIRDVPFSGKDSVSIIFRQLPLLSGTYLISAGIFDRKAIYVYDLHDMLYPFEIHTQLADEGLMHIPHQWTRGVEI